MWYTESDYILKHQVFSCAYITGLLLLPYFLSVDLYVTDFASFIGLSVTTLAYYFGSFSQEILVFSCKNSFHQDKIKSSVLLCVSDH